MTVPHRPAPPHPRSAGVRDVARLAQVSLGTVSNVLNNPDLVTPATRERVQRAMDDLGFVPSRAAGSLRSRSSDLVGVVVPDVGNPFWGDVLRGVERVLEEHGLTLVVASTRQDAGREHRVLRALDEQRVDGLVVAPVAVGLSELQRFRERRLGVVTLDRALGGDELASVTLDDVRGAEMAARHLLEQGHRRLVLVNGPQTISWCADRRAGATRAVVAAGLDPAEALFEVVVDDLTVADGLAAVPQVVAVPSATGILCANDLLALGVLRGLRTAGHQVPRDYSLVGYDDVEFAAVLFPPLTTVRQPSSDMGAAAARLLVTAPDARHPQVRFEPELIVRESTAPASRAPLPSP